MSLIPLESNPEVMNKFLVRLGVPDKWHVVDVLSLDADMLGLIPRPTLALILLYPTSDKYKNLKAEKEAEAKEKGQRISDNVYYLKQVVHNTCGSVALIHGLANNQELIQLGDGILKQFLEDTKSLNPEERGNILANHSGFITAHKDTAAEGQSEVLPDEKIIHHFVAFIHKDGDLYELDGRFSSPIIHGPSSADTFLEDAAKVIRDIMKKDPDEIGFTVCALTANDE